MIEELLTNIYYCKILLPFKNNNNNKKGGEKGESQFQESSTYLRHGWHGFNLKFSQLPPVHDLISTAERFEAPKTPERRSTFS